MTELEPLPVTIFHEADNGAPGPIESSFYTPTPDDITYMRLAMGAASDAAREGDSPIGATLVLPDGDVFVDETREFRDDDLSGHAEMRLISRARYTIGRDLGKCTMYSVAEPCYGCTYLLDKGNIGRLVIAARREDVDFFTRKSPEMHDIFANSRRRFEVVSGLLLPEARELLVRENQRHREEPGFTDRLSGGA